MSRQRRAPIKRTASKSWELESEWTYRLQGALAAAILLGAGLVVLAWRVADLMSHTPYCGG